MKKILLSLSLACLGLTINGYAQVIWTQDFEATTGTALPTGWTQTVASGTPNDSVGWNSGTSATLTSSGFNPNAHTRFVAVNDDAHQFADNSNSLLKTQSFSLTGYTAPYVSFDYLAGTYGGFTEQATVEASIDGGTTWTVISTLSANAQNWWEPRYISLASVGGMPNVMLGFRYKDNTGWLYGFGIDNVSVFNPPADDLGLSAISPMTGSNQNYSAASGTQTMTGTVFNYGSAAVTSYNINYVFNGGAVVTNTISGVSIAPFTSATFTDPSAITLPATLGAYPVRMWVSLTGDANATNDTSAHDTLNVVSFLPKKRLMFEEATGAWCGWCVRGIVFMDSLNRAYPDGVNIVSVHNGDSMTLNNASATAYDGLIGGMVPGFPNMVIDRNIISDPSDCFTDYANHSNDFGYADLGLIANIAGGTITAKVEVKPAQNLTGDYRLEVVVEENDVTYGSGGPGPANMWIQHNYYAVGGAGNATPMQTIGYDFNTLPSDIPNVHFPFVARTTLPASLSSTPNGVSGSLPGTMTAGSLYNWTSPAITMQTGYDGWNPANLVVIALLLDNTAGSPTFGHILNSIKSKGLLTGVSNVSAGVQNLQVYPNPANNDAHVRFELADATTVNFSVYDMTGREVFTAPAEAMSAGGHQINFTTNELASGVYNVMVRTENGTLSQRLSVVK